MQITEISSILRGLRQMVIRYINFMNQARSEFCMNSFSLNSNSFSDRLFIIFLLLFKKELRFREKGFIPNPVRT